MGTSPPHLPEQRISPGFISQVVLLCAMPYKDPEARNAYARQWYAENREKHLALVYRTRGQRRQRNRDYVNAIKARPCTDCGVSYPSVCMDFDHISDDKENVISQLVHIGSSLKRIQGEIDKCEVVCANCHRIRTSSRM